jgi:hypothetical protein
MKPWRKVRDTARDDRGAILVFALIIITTIALVVGMVLTRGDGSLRATVALRQVAGSSYAADAAANVALNDLRTGQWLGTAPKTSPSWAYDNNPFDGCFGRDGDATNTTPRTGLTLPSFYPATGSQTLPTSAYVECTPEDATGQQGTPVAINDANKPGNAILTLGTGGGEDGFTFKTNGTGGAFRVKGGIWSNSTIVRSNNGILQSTESIRAHSGCTPASAMSAPVVDCSAGTVPDPGDPAQPTAAAYQNNIELAGGTVPALATVPGCGTGSVELQPGYYDDVSKLNALTPNGSSNCRIHFNPGTYYFDFHNNSSDPLYQANLGSNIGNVWTVNSGILLGGTLTSATTIPGRCVSPIDSTTADGVQFVFGGDSRMAVDKGAQVELCGTYYTNRPPIVVYGQRTGTATQTQLTVASGNALTPSGAVTVAPAGTFSNGGVAPTAANLAGPGNGGASWARTSTGAPNSATVTVGGFKTTTDLPAGTVLTGAKLKVTHAEKTASSITFQPTGGTVSPSFNLPLQTGAATTDTVDISTNSGAWSTLQKYVHDNGYKGGQIVFTGNPKNGETTTLDGVQLELSYYTPQLRGEPTTSIPGNTVATVGGQPVISALGNTTVFYTQGTTYIPKGSLYLSLNNISESVFRFGVIARSLQIFETASFAYTGAVIELPDNSPGWGTKSTLVQLKVYLCPGSGTCSSGGQLALTARAQIWDPTGTVSPPARQVNVLSWSHTR